VNGLTSIPYCPHTPTRRQRLFLALDTFEAMYGGQAGGGKSDALLMAALQHVDRPGYSALCLRRTFADLNKPGALMDRAAEWLRPTAARWIDRDHRWLFPVGAGTETASLSFGYMETEQDRYQYQGAEYQYVAFDELTQFTETQYLYLASRLRQPRGGVLPLRLRSATNPGGVGHAWVKRRFVEPRSSERPFVSSGLDDNPHVDVEGYKRALSVLDKATRDQLERGLWVLDNDARIYHYDPSSDVARVPGDLDPSLWRRILAVDLGSSTRSKTTAFVLLAWHPHCDVTYAERAWCESGMVPSRLAEVIEGFVENDPELTVVMDEGALGHSFGNEMRNRHRFPVIAAEKRDKAGARRLINGAFEQRKLLLVSGQCEPLRKELEELIYDKRGMDAAPGLPDHATDALLYGWRMSRAHHAEAAPAPPPAPNTPEWHAQRARDALEREMQEARLRASSEGYVRW